MKKIIFIISGIVLVAALSAGGWWWYQNNNFADGPLIGTSQVSQIQSQGNVPTEQPIVDVAPPDNGTDQTGDIDNALKGVFLDDGNGADLNAVQQDLDSL